MTSHSMEESWEIDTSGHHPMCDELGEGLSRCER